MCSRNVNALEPAVDKAGHAQCTGNTSREPGTVRVTARRPHFSLAFISVTVQVRILVFLVISVYFNLRNILPKSGTFPPGHPVYIHTYIHTHARARACVCVWVCGVEWRCHIRSDTSHTCIYVYMYRGVDKSLARSRRKQSTATIVFKFHTSHL